jgi:hypothetical protein
MAEARVGRSEGSDPGRPRLLAAPRAASTGAGKPNMVLDTDIFNKIDDQYWYTRCFRKTGSTWKLFMLPRPTTPRRRAPVTAYAGATGR